MTHVQGFLIALVVIGFGYEAGVIDSRAGFFVALAMLVLDLWFETARKDRKR